MILGTGIDLADPARLREACRRHQRLLARLFTEGEQADCLRHRDPWPSFAARFAAKEAFVKALGTGLRRGLTWKQVEVLRDAQGRPSLALHDRAAVLLDEIGGRRVHLSLSHLDGMALAQVILEDDR